MITFLLNLIPDRIFIGISHWFEIRFMRKMHDIYCACLPEVA